MFRFTWYFYNIAEFTSLASYSFYFYNDQANLFISQLLCLYFQKLSFRGRKVLFFINHIFLFEANGFITVALIESRWNLLFNWNFFFIHSILYNNQRWYTGLPLLFFAYLEVGLGFRFLRPVLHNIRISLFVSSMPKSYFFNN